MSEKESEQAKEQKPKWTSNTIYNDKTQRWLDTVDEGVQCGRG